LHGEASIKRQNEENNKLE